LQANEYTKEFSGPGSIKYYDSNQLASNNPIEDTRSEAQCLLTKGIVQDKTVANLSLLKLLVLSTSQQYSNTNYM